MKIGLDIDGVAFDFVSNMRDHLAAHWGADATKLADPDCWEMWRSWGMSEDCWRAAFDKGVADGFLFNGSNDVRGYLYPGVVDGVRKWKGDGHEVVVITHRPDAAQNATHAWLNAVGLSDIIDGVRFSADKTCVPVDVIVEDNVDNALAVIKGGGRAILIDRPWNRRWALCEGHTVAVDNLPAARTGRLQRAYGWWDASAGGVVELVDKIVADVERRQASLEQLAEDLANGGIIKGLPPLLIGEGGCVLPPFHNTESDTLEVHRPSGEVRVTSDTGGQKGSKPQQVAQIPPRFLMALGEVYALGAAKYPDAEPGRPNWSRGYEWSLSYNALHRHLAAMWGGEWLDPEDGLPHIVKVAWHAATLYTFEGEGLGVDDRPAYYSGRAS